MDITRRTLLRLSGIAAGALSWPLRRVFAAMPQTPKGGPMTITILHTNDIHGHLTPWLGWEGDLKGKTVGGLGRLAGAVVQARKDAGEGVVMEAAAAKYFASEMVGRVADKAVQIFGGAGYIADYGIERFYRDVRIFRIYEGTSQIQQLIIARETLKRGG